MNAYLQGQFGRIVLGPDVVTIGRAKDNRLVINNPIASSHHAEIRSGVSGSSITDLGSTNGTFVNEQYLAPHLPRLLQGGDRIRIGDMTFMYESGPLSFQSPLGLHSSHADLPTAKVRAIDMTTFNQSEQFGDKLSGPYSSSLLQPATIPPTAEQSNTPGWTSDQKNWSAMPAQLMPSPFKPLQTPPYKQKSNTWLKLLLAGLAIVLVLGVAGGGITAYILTRPQPVMTVASAYQVGTTPAGSTGTVLHVSAHSFSGSSTIFFMLDSLPVASQQHLRSDANGTVRADLQITNDWPLGTHKLTARDAGGYETKAGIPVLIVAQGQAHTPGPYGAPPDDMGFTLQVKVQPQDAGTGKQLASYTETLIVTGKTISAGGTVCQSYDDGQQHTYIGNSGNGVSYRQTIVLTCSGIYKEGKLTYTETVTSEKEVYSDGTSCQEHVPYIMEHFEGTFTSQYTISGTFSSDSVIADCSRGSDTQQFNENAQKGSWTGQR